MGVMLRLREPSARDLDAMLVAAAAAEPTYSEIGATRNDALPDGYTHDRYHATLPRDGFDRAVDGLRHWQAHRGAGVTIHPAGAPVEPGANVLVVARVGPVSVIAPCRVVYVVTERDRFGFAYGTLPGHPERGEEAFIVERTAAASSFSIVAFSRPAALTARLGRPIARRVQRRFTRAYLDALAEGAAAQH